MKRWYRMLVVVMALAAVLCTSMAACAGVRMVEASRWLLSNEKLIRTVSEWVE